MQNRLLRALLALTTLAVVWLVAPSAFAAPAGSASSMPPAVSSATLMMSMVPVSDANANDAPKPYESAGGAPLCDPRGATTFAPPPQMQDAEVSLDASTLGDDCTSSGTSRDALEHRVAPGRVPLPLDASDSTAHRTPALLTAVPTLAAVARELLPIPAATERARPGIRGSVERPPRV